MPDAPFIALVHNAALLLALVLVYDLVVSRYPLAKKPGRQLIIGVVLGSMGVGIMLAPFQLVPGIVFDTRSVLLAVSGLFFGLMPTLVAMLLTAACRLSQGGAAAWVGIAVIFASGSLGLLWRRRHRQTLADITWRQLYGLGLAVHVVMLLLMLTLGWNTGRDVLAAIGLPVLVIYPVATTALGLLLANQLRREQAAAAQQESEQRWQFALEGVGDGVWDWDVAGRRLFYSTKWKNMLGYDEADIGHTLEDWSDRVHPEDLPRAMAAVQAHLDGRTDAYTTEHRVRCKDGGYKWVLDRGLVVSRDAAGRPLRMVGTQVDISARKEAEAVSARQQQELQNLVRQLEDSRGMLQSIIESIPVRVFWKDKDLRYQGCNSLFAHDAGFRHPAELQGKDDQAMGWKAQAELYQKADREVMATGLPKLNIIEPQTTPLGATIWLSTSKVPLKDSDGAVVGLLGTYEDITSRKLAEARLAETNRVLQAEMEERARAVAQARAAQDETARLLAMAEQSRRALLSVVEDHRAAEQALQESQERYRLIAENTNDVIWLFDLVAGKFNYLSPSAERLLGYTREEMMDWHVHSVLTLESVAEARRVLRKRLAGIAAGDLSGVHHAGLYDLVRKDGTIRNGEVASTILLNAAGQPTQFLGITRDITDRRQAEAQLKKLSGAVEQSPASIVITNLAGDIEYVNPWFTSLTGYTLEEVRGQNPRLLKSGLTPGDTYDEMWRTLTAGKVWRGRLHNRKKNGENYVEQAVIAPVFGPDGRATHYVAIKDDITAHVRMETALRESEQRFRELFDLESDVILVIDSDTGEIVQANQAAGTTYGYAVAELVSMSSFDLTNEAEMTREIHRQARQNPDQMIRVPHRLHRRRDGTVFPVEISIRSFRRAGRFMHVSVIRDVTEQVRARETLERFNAELEQQVGLRTEELAARNRHIQALLSSIPDTVMLLHTAGHVLHSQPAHHGSTALAAITPATGATPGTGASADLLAASLDLGRRALAAGATTTGEAEIATPGGPLALELHTAPTGTDQFVAFVRDITARKRLETETTRLLERERQVSEMKTRFISVTSHEFRTPMTTIMGSVELLANHLERLTPDKRAQIFERVNSSLQRMTTMLDDVLTLNRMDANRTEVRLTTINLGPFLANVVQEIRTADRDEHRFELQLPAGTATFVTDQNLLHHIATNLLSNAVRYSPAGTTVIVGVQSDAWRLHLSVEDQGIGIPPADRVRIFEPFERGSNVGQIKGNGLGLNIVKRMIELLDGAITLRPVPGGGTRFTVALPHPNPAPPPS